MRANNSTRTCVCYYCYNLYWAKQRQVLHCIFKVALSCEEKINLSATLIYQLSFIEALLDHSFRSKTNQHGHRIFVCRGYPSQANYLFVGAHHWPVATPVRLTTRVKAHGFTT